MRMARIAGRKRTSASRGCTSSIRASRRRQSVAGSVTSRRPARRPRPPSGSRRAGWRPRGRGRRSASGPAAEAVVTVTEARPSSWAIGPRCRSTVWTRLIGAIRALLEQPAALGVDRVLGGLPPVHPVAPPRHDDDVGGPGHEPDCPDHPVRPAPRCVVDEPPHDLGREQDGHRAEALERPQPQRPARDAVRRGPQRRHPRPARPALLGRLPGPVTPIDVVHAPTVSHLVRVTRAADRG